MRGLHPCPPSRMSSGPWSEARRCTALLGKHSLPPGSSLAGSRTCARAPAFLAGLVLLWSLRQGRTCVTDRKGLDEEADAMTAGQHTSPRKVLLLWKVLQEDNPILLGVNQNAEHGAHSWGDARRRQGKEADTARCEQQVPGRLLSFTPYVHRVHSATQPSTGQFKGNEQNFNDLVITVGGDEGNLSARECPAGVQQLCEPALYSPVCTPERALGFPRLSNEGLEVGICELKV